MRFVNRALLVVLLVSAASISGEQAKPGAAKDPMDRITQADLKSDLFVMAGDSMRGREGGTIDELNASMWLAERCRAIGLKPGGDNGTYFQFFPLERFRISSGS